jgi:tyrosinase
MLDPIASPGDPLFYLHHTWLDKIWWDWQALDLEKRLTDISGPNIPRGFGGGFPGGGFPGGNGTNPFPGWPGGNGTFPGFPGGAPGGGGSDPWRNVPPDAMIPPANSPDPEGDPGSETTLSHILHMYGVVPDATIADVMDIRGPLLCFEYV